MDNSVSAGTGALFIIIVFLLFCLCCPKRHQRGIQQNDHQPRGHRRRQKNARRKWRRRRQDGGDRVAILDPEGVVPELAVPQQPLNPNHHFIITLHPPSQMPFQATHCPPSAPFQTVQQPWQQPNLHYPPPQHVNVSIPHNDNNPVTAPYVHQQQQPDGFAQLYAQAQPDMSVFPQPPPPYETEPFPHLPQK